MSFRAELANAARWMNAAALRLPEHHGPDLALEWAALMDRLEDCRSEGSKELAIIEWRKELEQRFASDLLHSPLT